MARMYAPNMDALYNFQLRQKREKELSDQASDERGFARLSQMQQQESEKEDKEFDRKMRVAELESKVAGAMGEPKKEYGSIRQQEGSEAAYDVGRYEKYQADEAARIEAEAAAMEAEAATTKQEGYQANQAANRATRLETARIGAEGQAQQGKGREELGWAKLREQSKKRGAGIVDAATNRFLTALKTDPLGGLTQDTEKKTLVYQALSQQALKNYYTHNDDAKLLEDLEKVSQKLGGGQQQPTGPTGQAASGQTVDDIYGGSR